MAFLAIGLYHTPSGPQAGRMRLWYTAVMTSNELRRWLRKQGCTFHPHRGGGSHVTVRLGDRRSELPMHGSKEIGRWLERKIKKDLGLL